MAIERNIIKFRDIDVVVIHDNRENTVSVNVYRNDNKILAGCELILIGRNG